MDKINFQNLPNTTTPVNATNLNQLQTNVENEFDGILDNARFITYSTSLTPSDSPEDIISDVLSQVTETNRVYLINVKFAGGGSSFMVIARKVSTNQGTALVIGHNTPFLGLRYVRLINDVVTITGVTNVETGTITPATGVTMNTASYLRKKDNIVDLFYGFNGIAISANTPTVVGTLPVGFRPNKTFYCVATFNYGFSATSGVQHICLILINANNGEIQFLSNDALSTSHTVRIKTSYIMD